jgi:predicted nucleic-acid-binding protein
LSAALDTNVLVRLLLDDEPTQSEFARAFVRRQHDAKEPVHLLLGTLLETESVLRSRYRIPKEDIARVFAMLLERSDVAVEDERAFEEALFNWRDSDGVDFTDALLCARTWSLGVERFVTFDARAARLPHAELLE